MHTFHGTFPTEPGVGIFVPSTAIRRTSINISKHPHTPFFYLLSRKDSAGLRYFLQNEHQRGKDEFRGGFNLFVPASTKPGDLLVIQWVESNCACARLATAAEIEDTKSKSEPDPEQTTKQKDPFGAIRW